MNVAPSVLAYLQMLFAGWVNCRRLILKEYLKAENEMLR
jgi:hypothetical protein